MVAQHAVQLNQQPIQPETCNTGPSEPHRPKQYVTFEQDGAGSSDQDNLTPLQTDRSAHFWVSSTYFAEGFPYSIVNNLAEILFKQMGASLQVIGLTSLFHLPWNLKFLWGPLVDHYETKRRWLLAVEGLLTIMLVGLALVVSANRILGLIAAAFGILAVLAATHDIAIDGFYLEGLDKRGQSKFVGYRAMAYKAASLLVRGPLLILIGWAGWRAGFGASAAVMLLLTLLHWKLLPKAERQKRSIVSLFKPPATARVLKIGALVAGMIALYRVDSAFLPWRHWGSSVVSCIQQIPAIGAMSTSGWITVLLLVGLVILVMLARPIKQRINRRDSYYAQAFVDFVAREKVVIVLAFVILFRTGESFLQKMKWPFLRDVMQMSLDCYGFVNGTLGVIASFVGTLLGGWLIARHGLKRWIWPFVLAQNVLNLLYAIVAMMAPQVTVGLGWLTLLITTEHLGEGLGTAVFMVYLMRCCDPRHKAAHMAILTALMSVSFTLAGVASGFLAAWMGFAMYFVFTFVATIPAMILIPWIPNQK